jgi:hypothetical protein
MSDEISYLKARYCRSVLTTANISSLEEARHLVRCLTSEPLTSDTSREVQIAERDALAAILTLHERFETRSAAAVAGDWKNASDAVLRWMHAAS